MMRNNRAWKSQVRGSHISTASTASTLLRHNNSTSAYRFKCDARSLRVAVIRFRASSLLSLFCHAVCASNTLSADLKTQ